MLYTGSAAKSSFFALCSFYTDATMVPSAKLEKPQLNEIDRIMLSSMKRSGGQCWWWAWLTAARKISNQVMDDSRYKFVMFKWLWGLYWCCNVHNFEISLYIMYAFTMIASKNSQTFLPTTFSTYGRLHNCALTGHAYQQHAYSCCS